MIAAFITCGTFALAAGLSSYSAETSRNWFYLALGGFIMLCAGIVLLVS